MTLESAPDQYLYEYEKQIRKLHKSPVDIQNHKLLVLWAADCAEHVLPYFEKEYSADDRPRKAIEEGRAWAHGDIPMKMSVIRGASLSAHAAARKADDPAARFAARAAGQAVAAVHVPRHALAASDYARKAAEAADVSGEREWQYSRLPEHLRPIAFLLYGTN